MDSDRQRLQDELDAAIEGEANARHALCGRPHRPPQV
jgi:hypothetical protein